MKQKETRNFLQDMTMREQQGVNIFEPIPEFFFSAIASGATPIGSAGRALDENNTRTTELG
jgi:hypothetical protein